MAELKAACSDNITFIVELRKDGAIKPVDPTSTVESILVRNSKASEKVVSTSVDSGADFPNGIIEIVFPGAVTGKLNPGRYDLHVAVTLLGKKRTWRGLDVIELYENYTV